MRIVYENRDLNSHGEKSWFTFLQESCSPTLVDKGAEVTPHCTSHSPYQGVARLLSTPFNVARPHFSSERGKNRCVSPSPYGHDGRINDGLGSGLRRQTGERVMDRRVPLLAHKLPGTQGCLPGFDIFLPVLGGASYHSQDGQHGSCVPHKPSGRFTVAHPGQACAPSSPWSQYKFLSLRAVHVLGILNLAADFLSRQKLRPGEWMLNHQTVSQIGITVTNLKMSKICMLNLFYSHTKLLITLTCKI